MSARRALADAILAHWLEQFGEGGPQTVDLALAAVDALWPVLEAASADVTEARSRALIPTDFVVEVNGS